MHVIDGIGRIVALETVRDLRLTPSYKVRTNVNDLKTFSWEKVLNEAKNCAPTLLHLLESCTRPMNGQAIGEP